MTEIQQIVRAFVCENFYIGSGEELDDEASFIDMGVVDSTGILEVVAFLEERFGIRIDDAELVPENLDSLGRITAFVARKKGAPL
jgi:acyl carrier protein